MWNLFKADEKVVVFESANSLRCYQIPTSLTETDLATTIAHLKRSFFWLIRIEPHHEDDRSAVSAFLSDDFELLTSWNDARLTKAINYRDAYSNGICMELIGFHRQPKDSPTATQIKDELTRFINSEATDIAVVIIRVGDSPFWYAYTARNIPDTVDQFIKNDLRVSNAKTIKRRAYIWLHMMKLESVYKVQGAQ